MSPAITRVASWAASLLFLFASACAGDDGIQGADYFAEVKADEVVGQLAAQFPAPNVQLEKGIAAAPKEPKNKRVLKGAARVRISDVNVESSKLWIRGGAIGADTLTASAAATPNVGARGLGRKDLPGGKATVTTLAGKSISMPLPATIDLAVKRGSEGLEVTFSKRPELSLAVAAAIEKGRADLRAAVNIEVKPEARVKVLGENLNLRPLVEEEVFDLFLHEMHAEVTKDKTLEKIERAIGRRLPLLALREADIASMVVMPGPDVWQVQVGEAMPAEITKLLSEARAASVRVAMDGEAFASLVRAAGAELARRKEQPDGFRVVQIEVPAEGSKPKTTRLVAEYAPRNAGERELMRGLFGGAEDNPVYQFDLGTVSGVEFRAGANGTLVSLGIDCSTAKAAPRTARLTVVLGPKGSIGLDRVSVAAAAPAKEEEAAATRAAASLTLLREGMTSLFTNTILSQRMVPAEHKLGRLSLSGLVIIGTKKYLWLEIEIKAFEAAPKP